MKNLYDIVQYKDIKIIIVNRYINPLSQFMQMNEDLKNMNYQGIIIIDQTLSNGYSSNRFLKCRFDNNKLDILNLKKYDCRDYEILKFLNNYYKNNNKNLENSSLSKLTIEAILNNDH